IVGHVYGTGGASGSNGMGGAMGGASGSSGLGGGFGGVGGGLGGGMGGGMGGMGGMGGGFGGMGGMGAMTGGMGNGIGTGGEMGGGQIAPAVANYQIPPGSARRGPRIEVKTWDPAAPYLRQLRAASSKEAFAVYMRNRARFGDSPAFFVDCADYFFNQREPDLAIQILSNLAELELDDAAPLHILGHRLAQVGAFDLAVLTLEEVLRIRPEDPQSYRDLALVLAQRAEAAARLQALVHNGAKTPRAPPALPQGSTSEAARRAIGSDYARAVDLLTEVVVRRWDSRFAEIELPVLMELNRILVKARNYGVEPGKLDPRLVKPLDVDVRIVVTSCAGNSGAKLEVTEPSVERAGGNHAQTAIGGLVGRPYAFAGPQEYLLHKAISGWYVVRVREAGNGNDSLLGPLTLRVDMYTQFGRENEQFRSLTVRLKNSREALTVGRIKF
ncbi:MAG: hypothetical protein ABSG53_24980, partial [Thermoguttaceae bacterium]